MIPTPLPQKTSPTSVTDFIHGKAFLNPVADTLVSSVDHVVNILGQTLKMAVPHMEVQVHGGMYKKNDMVRDCRSLYVIPEGIDVILDGLMVEFPMMIKGLSSIHRNIIDAAIVLVTKEYESEGIQHKVTERNPEVRVRVTEWTDMIHSFMRGQIAMVISPDVKQRLNQLGIEDPAGIQKGIVAHDLVGHLLRGDYWELDDERVISREDRTYLTKLIGHTPAIDWFQHALQGEIEPSTVSVRMPERR